MRPSRFGSRFILRLVRRPEEEHPDLEVVQFLAEHGFTHCPPVRGVMSYRAPSVTATLAVLQDYVAHETDGWQVTLDELGRYCGADPHRRARAPHPRREHGRAGRARPSRRT